MTKKSLKNKSKKTNHRLQTPKIMKYGGSGLSNSSAFDARGVYRAPMTSTGARVKCRNWKGLYKKSGLHAHAPAREETPHSRTRPFIPPELLRDFNTTYTPHMSSRTTGREDPRVEEARRAREAAREAAAREEAAREEAAREEARRRPAAPPQQMSRRLACKILNVPQTATREEITKAYHRLARQHHPDKGGDEETFKVLNEAYHFLIPDGGSKKKSRTRRRNI